MYTALYTEFSRGQKSLTNDSGYAIVLFFLKTKYKNEEIVAWFGLLSSFSISILSMHCKCKLSENPVEIQNRSNYTRCVEYRSTKDSAVRQIR